MQGIKDFIKILPSSIASNYTWHAATFRTCKARVRDSSGYPFAALALAAWGKR